jgi:hypothetical protein
LVSPKYAMSILYFAHNSSNLIKSADEILVASSMIIILFSYLSLKASTLEESFSNSEIRVNSEFSGRTSDKFFTCSALFAANIQFFSGLTAFSIE